MTTPSSWRSFRASSNISRVIICKKTNKSSVTFFDRSVGIVLGYRLDDLGSRVWFLVGAGNFSLHHRVQNISGAHPASYPMGTRGSFPGGKVDEAWSWPLSFIYHQGQRISAAIPPLLQYTFMAWCSVKKKAQGQLYLYLYLYLLLHLIKAHNNLAK
jgi:hypothetical protein